MASLGTCPQFECAMKLARAMHRPSWRELFYGEHQPTWWGIDGSGWRTNSLPKAFRQIEAVQHEGQVNRSECGAQPIHQNRHNRSDRPRSVGWKTCEQHVVNTPIGQLDCCRKCGPCRTRISQTRRSDFAQRTIYPSVLLHFSWDRLLFVVLPLTPAVAA